MAQLSLRKLLSSSIMAPAVVLALAGGMTPVAVQAQVLEVGVDSSPVGLDPHLITAFPSFQVVSGTIYEGLTAIDKDLRVQPSLAQSWTVSADGKTYVFKLRAGMTFHNGAPVEAADVVASFHRVTAKDIASPLASRLATMAGVVATDPLTVTLTLKEPTAPLLVSLATLAIVPRAFEADKDSLQRNPVGTGPFKFKEWQPNGFIALSKNEHYWRAGAPKLDGIKFDIVPESATRQVGIASGQFGMLANIDPATALQLKDKPNVRLAETLELSYTLIGMNASKPPFNNPKVREAFEYALDRPEIIAAALFGAGVPAGPLSPALKEWATPTSAYPCYKHDPAKAMALLKEAGVAMPVAITMNVLPRQDIKDIAQVAQAQLNKAGFRVELKNQEIGAFVQDWRNSNFETFASANGGSPDPSDYFDRTFHTGGSTNVFKYGNPEVDSLLDNARGMTDMAARKAAYAKVQAILACQGPAAHIAYGQLFTALRPNVVGFEMMANRSLAGLADTAIAK